MRIGKWKLHVQAFLSEKKINIWRRLIDKTKWKLNDLDVYKKLKMGQNIWKVYVKSRKY